MRGWGVGEVVGVFHRHNPLNLVPQINGLACDVTRILIQIMNLLIYLRRWIQIHWITHDPLQSNGGKLWHQIARIVKCLLYL